MKFKLLEYRDITEVDSLFDERIPKAISEVIGKMGAPFAIEIVEGEKRLIDGRAKEHTTYNFSFTETELLDDDMDKLHSLNNSSAGNYNVILPTDIGEGGIFNIVVEDFGEI